MWSSFWSKINQRWLKLENVGILLVLGVAILLRFTALGQVGFNSDEAVYAGQAAAIARDETLSPFFPVFRAHPLLFQFLLSLVFRIGVSDLTGRIVSAIFGVLTVLVVYALGRHLYDMKVGLLAALFLAIMPYHVIITRQVILDGSMTFFATLTLYLLARYATSTQPAWLYASSAAMGLTFLCKETSIVLIVAIYAFFALSPAIKIRLKDLVFSMGLLALVVLPFPLTIALAGGGGAEKSQQYLVWQLFRRPNHEWWFYPIDVFPTIGILIILSALLGLWVYRKENSWREVLLGVWILIPLIFFQSWPVKGFHYLLVLSTPVAVLAARFMGQWTKTWQGLKRNWLDILLYSGLLVLLSLSLFIPSWMRIQPQRSATFLAGSGGVPGGREAGLWLRENSPEGSTLMTIGPSMANILQFYGHRKAFGLSVSPNPLHRNPSYTPIRNPDFEIRTGEFQYLIWDSYSAGRSVFFSEKLLEYVQRYNGRVVHTEAVSTTLPEGDLREVPVIIIYEVRP